MAFESSWSAFARSAPFLEQGSFYNAINFNYTYSDPPNTTVANTPLSLLYCPSDPGSHIDDASLGGTGYATTSYGTCDGDWYVWSVNWGATNTVGPMNRSLFGPNYARRIAMVTDGTSNTLMASEGLIGHAQMRSCLNTPSCAFGSHQLGPGARPTSRFPARIRPRALASLIASCGTATGKVKAGGPIGHTRWCNGGVYYSGFTTAMPPNPTVSRPSAGPPASPTPARTCRWTGTRSTRTTAARPTCRWRPAATTPAASTPCSPTAASTSIKNSVSPVTWRSLGTIAGGEVVCADQY